MIERERTVLLVNEMIEKLLKLNFQYTFSTDIDDIQITIHVKHRNTISGAAVYMYFDDVKTMYISNLFVDEKFRKLGHGQELYNICEALCIYLNTEQIFLSCKIGSWVSAWYTSLMYTPYNKDNDSEYVWMVKDIDVS